MKSKTTASDVVKNIIIAVLVVTTAFLSFKAFTNSDDPLWVVVTGLFKGEEEKTEGAASGSMDGMDIPVYIMITSPSGEHYADKYGYQSKTDLFAQYSVLLGEAMGSAASPQKLTDEQWQAVLKYSNVFFDYLYPRPLSYIASSLGVRVSDKLVDMDASRLCIACDGEDMIFAFINQGSGNVYAYSTALDSSILYGQIVQQSMNNSHFAFELGESYSYLDEYFIFSDEDISLRTVSATSPTIELLDIQSILGAFHMSDRASQEYPGNDGSTVYVDGSKSLRTESGGKVVFSASGAEGALAEELDASAGRSDYILSAQTLVTTVLSKYIGEARVECAAYEFAADLSSAVISFNYSVDGTPVSRGADIYAATVKYSGGDIVRVELNIRTYTYTGTQVTPLPEAQAAALASVSGGMPALFYEDIEGSGSYNWLLM